MRFSTVGSLLWISDIGLSERKLFSLFESMRHGPERTLLLVTIASHALHGDTGGPKQCQVAISSTPCLIRARINNSIRIEVGNSQHRRIRVSRSSTNLPLRPTIQPPRIWRFRVFSRIQCGLAERIFRVRSRLLL